MQRIWKVSEYFMCRASRTWRAAFRDVSCLVLLQNYILSWRHRMIFQVFCCHPGIDSLVVPRNEYAPYAEKTDNDAYYEESKKSISNLLFRDGSRQLGFHNHGYLEVARDGFKINIWESCCMLFIIIRGQSNHHRYSSQSRSYFVNFCSSASDGRDFQVNKMSVFKAYKAK